MINTIPVKIMNIGQYLSTNAFNTQLKRRQSNIILSKFSQSGLENTKLIHCHFSAGKRMRFQKNNNHCFWTGSPLFMSVSCPGLNSQLKKFQH